MNVSYAQSFKFKEEFKEGLKILEKVCGVKDDINIQVFNSKGQNTYGRCRQVGDRKYDIYINQELSKKEDIINTVIHELLHAYYFPDGHKGRWKVAALKVSEATPYCITRCSNKKLNTQPKKVYILTCHKCGKIVARRLVSSKIIQHPNFYTSRCCGASLDLRVEYLQEDKDV